MDIYNLSVAFFTKRAERDEKKRRIEYDLPAELKSLESAKYKTEGRVYIEEFKEGIEQRNRIS